MKNSALILLLLLTGCGSGSVSNCKDTDWQIIGRIDEELGQADFKRKYHKKQCKKKFDSESWEEGRKVGAIFRCSPNGAYFAGKRSQNFPSLCSVDKHKELNVAYQDGKYTAKQIAKQRSLEEELEKAREQEAKKAEQKSSWSQDLGRRLFNGPPRSEQITDQITKLDVEIHRMESKYIPPYAIEYP